MIVKMNKKFQVINNYYIEDLRRSISVCQKLNHVQQVAFSTFHDSLTQVCFGCEVIRTSMREKDYVSKTKKELAGDELTTYEFDEVKDEENNGHNKVKSGLKKMEKYRP